MEHVEDRHEQLSQAEETEAFGRKLGRFAFGASTGAVGGLLGNTTAFIIVNEAFQQNIGYPLQYLVGIPTGLALANGFRAVRNTP